MSRISELEITTTQGDGNLNNNGKLSLKCPHDSGSSLENTWFEFTLAKIMEQQRSGKFRLFLDTRGVEHLLLDKSLISAITITLS